MATITQEISVKAANTPGTLGKAAGCIKEAGVLIQGICAWGEGNESTFMFLTDNPQKCAEILKKAGYSPTTHEVVTSKLLHRVGTLAEACHKLGTAGINIDHCWATATGANSIVVFATDDNKKTAQMLD